MVDASSFIRSSPSIPTWQDSYAHSDLARLTTSTFFRGLLQISTHTFRSVQFKILFTDLQSNMETEIRGPGCATYEEARSEIDKLLDSDQCAERTVRFMRFWSPDTILRDMWEVKKAFDREEDHVYVLIWEPWTPGDSQS